MKLSIPLLLTSSVIAHDLGVKLTDTDERLRHTIESIERWLNIDPSLHIVLCDGSNFDLQSRVLSLFPNAAIECLRFENNQDMVKKYGRGYGEGEIVRYALANSKLIERAGCFVKCSSKLWIENFNDCKQFWNGEFLCKGVFLNAFSIFKKTQFQYIDTRFYFSSKSFYEHYFLNAHQEIGAVAGRSLEECFHNIVLREGIKRFLLPVAPVIQGVGGGIGTYYQNSVKRVIKEKLRILLVRRDTEYADLFADRGRSVNVSHRS